MGGLSNHIVTAESRAAVGEYLNTVTQEMESLDNLHELAIKLGTFGQDVIWALAERIDDKEILCRVMAAWMLLAIGRRPEFTVDESTVAQATQVVATSLQTGSGEQRLWACVLLAQGDVPTECIEPLRQLMDSDDGRLQVFAAAALSNCDHAGSEGIIILGQALHHENEILAATAASAFGRLGMRPDAIPILIQKLEEVKPEIQYHLLQSLKQIGPPAKSANPALVRMIENTSAHPVLRGAAACALASVTKGSQKALPVLTDSLRSGVWEVIDGAVDGFVILGHYPEAAIDQLAALLYDNDYNLRGIAATGLCQLGPRAAKAVKALVGRVGEEQDVQIVSVIASALAAIGVRAIPDLVELLKTTDMQKISVAGGALMQMGPDAAAALAELLASESSERVRRAIVMALREMGSNAAPAVPTLAKLLEETTDDELAGYAVIAISLCGQAAEVAAPSLVQRLIGPHEEIAYYAERALMNIGPFAIPALRRAQTAEANAGQERLAALLTRLEPTADKLLRKFAGIDRTLLEVFIGVGDILIEHGAISQLKLQ